jgi:hypothetical protein
MNGCQRVINSEMMVPSFPLRTFLPEQMLFYDQGEVEKKLLIYGNRNSSLLEVEILVKRM